MLKTCCHVLQLHLGIADRAVYERVGTRGSFRKNMISSLIQTGLMCEGTLSVLLSGAWSCQDAPDAPELYFDWLKTAEGAAHVHVAQYLALLVPWVSLSCEEYLLSNV